MPKTLYAVTAIKNGLPVGAFVIAANPDECTARAMQRLGDRGRLTHIAPLCEATLGTLKRNGLLPYCGKGEQIEFLTDTLLEIIAMLLDQVATLRAALGSVTGTLQEKLNLKRFKFSAKDREGVTQFHETFAPDFGTAYQAIMELCQTEYGTTPDFVAEVPNE